MQADSAKFTESSHFREFAVRCSFFILHDLHGKCKAGERIVIALSFPRRRFMFRAEARRLRKDRQKRSEPLRRGCIRDLHTNGQHAVIYAAFDGCVGNAYMRSARRLAGKGILFCLRTVGGFRFRCHREERSDAAISQFSVMNLLFRHAGKGIGRIRRDDVGIVPYGSPGGTAGACCLARPAAFALNLNGTQNAREEHTDSCVGADAHIGPITFPDPSAAQGADRSARRLAGKGILLCSRTVGGFRFRCHREERSDAAISQRCRLSCCFLPASD